MGNLLFSLSCNRFSIIQIFIIKLIIKMNKYRDRLEEDVRNWYSNSNLNEAMSTDRRGSFNGPLQPGIKKFKKIDMEPFTIPVSKYNDAMLGYDSYDG
jgi:hypothetical protein